MKPTNPHDLLRHHVSGAIQRGEAEPIIGRPASEALLEVDRKVAEAMRDAVERRP